MPGGIESLCAHRHHRVCGLHRRRHRRAEAVSSLLRRRPTARRQQRHFVLRRPPRSRLRGHDRRRAPASRRNHGASGRTRCRSRGRVRVTAVARAAAGIGRRIHRFLPVLGVQVRSYFEIEHALRVALLRELKLGARCGRTKQSRISSRICRLYADHPRRGRVLVVRIKVLLGHAPRIRIGPLRARPVGECSVRKIVVLEPFEVVAGDRLLPRMVAHRGP
mmetsp:Transcript_27578/g.69537  ORF Transcript_27578/g.69537 Transcript_27578/m.69537 type:complete len:220 (+) Transcript_27578:764-1423(+)